MKTQHHSCLSLLMSAALASTSTAQSPAPAPPAPAPGTWSQTLGGAVSEQGLHDLRLLPGGQLVVAGYTASFGGPTQSNWLLNLDLASGAVNTERTSTSIFGGITDGAAIAADGGALFLGRDVLDIHTKHDAWLMRVDANGHPLWSQGFTRPGVGRHFLFDAAELPDGSWIAVGATGLFDFPPQAAWVVRISSTGALLWHYEYGGGVVDSARSVTLTSDGGFAIAGATNSSGAGDDDVWVMKIDANGVVQWQKTFGGAETDQAEDIVELADGGFAVVGSTNSLTASGHAPWILRLDAAGALLWHRVVVDGVWGDLGAAARTSDNELVVVGRVAENGFPSNDLWCAKLDISQGRVYWQHAYEGDLGDFGTAVLPLDGPGVKPGFVVGGTWGWGFPGESIWLTRTGRTGGIGCNFERTTKFKMTRPTITIRNGVAVRVPGGAITEDPGMQESPSNATVIDVCN